jgi:hypothetical protein
MYVTAPPARGARPVSAFRLARVEHQVLGTGQPFGGEDRIYFTDLMAAYGVECRQEQFDGRRNSYTDLVLGMLPRLHPFDDRFDVAVLTGVTTDSHPGFPMASLTERVDGAGLAFAVLDQGVVTPFTALRVLASTLRGAGPARALLIVVDQSALMHDEPVAPRFRIEHDSAVVLVLDAGGDLGTVSVPRSYAVSADDIGAHLATPGPVICGQGLAPHASALDEVVHAPAGLPATGVWATLAANLDRLRGGRVVLADYDEDLGLLATCAVDLAP